MTAISEVVNTIISHLLFLWQTASNNVGNDNNNNNNNISFYKKHDCVTTTTTSMMMSPPPAAPGGGAIMGTTLHAAATTTTTTRILDGNTDDDGGGGGCSSSSSNAGGAALSSSCTGRPMTLNGDDGGEGSTVVATTTTTPYWVCADGCSVDDEYHAVGNNNNNSNNSNNRRWCSGSNGNSGTNVRRCLSKASPERASLSWMVINVLCLVYSVYLGLNAVYIIDVVKGNPQAATAEYLIWSLVTTAIWIVEVGLRAAFPLLAGATSPSSSSMSSSSPGNGGTNRNGVVMRRERCVTAFELFLAIFFGVESVMDCIHWKALMDWSVQVDQKRLLRNQEIDICINIAAYTYMTHATYKSYHKNKNKYNNNSNKTSGVRSSDNGTLRDGMVRVLGSDGYNCDARDDYCNDDGSGNINRTRNHNDSDGDNGRTWYGAPSTEMV